MADPEEQLIPFKMFGLQRTGTNLAVALLTRNFFVHSLEIGAEWKHGPLEEPMRMWNGVPARFVLCVKNPHAWLVSCFRYFGRACGADRTVAPQFVANRSMSFEEFVRTPTYQFASPVHRWNEMNRLWLASLPAARTAVVRHEDQLKNQVRVMGTVQRKLGLVPRGQLQMISQRVDVNARVGGDMDREFYLKAEYLGWFEPDLLAWVDHQLDAGLLKRFRYRRASRSSGPTTPGDRGCDALTA